MSRENFAIGSNKNLNYQMCILSVIAICMVVLGHIKNDLTSVGTFFGLFPYYSVHLPIFMFISGYFFKDEHAGESYGKYLGKYILHKIKTILIPYYVINGIFLLLNFALADRGFTYVRMFSFKEWLLQPWTKFYTITFSSPTWYLVGFFIASIYYVLVRKLVRLIIRNDLAMEIILTVLTLVMGMAGVYVCNTLRLPEAAQVYLRSVVMLFFIQLGRLYKSYLENLDTCSSIIYFAVVFALQILLIRVLDNNPLNPQLYEMTGFDRFGCNMLVAGIMGVALWLRISKLLAQIPIRSKLVIFIGSNTKYIMAFHIVGFFLLNCNFAHMHARGIGPDFIANFNPERFHTYLYYFCVDNVRLVFIYFIAGMAVSLALAWIITLVKKWFRKISVSRANATR